MSNTTFKIIFYSLGILLLAWISLSLYKTISAKEIPMPSESGIYILPEDACQP